MVTRSLLPAPDSLLSAAPFRDRSQGTFRPGAKRPIFPAAAPESQTALAEDEAALSLSLLGEDGAWILVTRETQCSHSTSLKVVAHVYIAHSGVFFAQPRHPNVDEWRRIKLKAKRWHLLPLRKLSRATITSFLPMSWRLCPWHRLLPLTNPSSFWFSACFTALRFFPLFVFL